jgi:cell-division protein
MKYVGATNSFIRWPFIIEGITIGILSALISVVLIGILYNIITTNIMASELAATINLSLLSFSDMFTLIMIVYVGLGIGIGIIGSTISMRKYLKV